MMEWEQGDKEFEEVRSGDYTVGYYETVVNRRWLAHYKGANYDTRIGNKEGYATKEEAMEACEKHAGTYRYETPEGYDRLWCTNCNSSYIMTIKARDEFRRRAGDASEFHGYVRGLIMKNNVGCCNNIKLLWTYKGDYTKPPVDITSLLVEEKEDTNHYLYCLNCKKEYYITDEVYRSSNRLWHHEVNDIIGCCGNPTLLWHHGGATPVDKSNARDISSLYIRKEERKEETVSKDEVIEVPKVYKVLLRKDDGTLVSPVAGSTCPSLVQEAREATELAYSIGGITHAPEGSDGIYVQDTLGQAWSFWELNGYLMKPGGKVIVEAIPLGKGDDFYDTYPAILVTSIVEEIEKEEVEREYTVKLTDSEVKDIKHVIRGKPWGYNGPLEKLHTALGGW